MKSVQRTAFGVLDKIVIANERAVRRGGQAILEKYRFRKSAFFCLRLVLEMFLQNMAFHPSAETSKTTSADLPESEVAEVGEVS